MAHQISRALRQAVRARAGGLCEYWHTVEAWQYVPFSVDHIQPLKLGGSSEPDNLALACSHCNRQKSDKVNALDPETGEQVNLFNPRQSTWADHFAWSADKLRIIGLTAVGRVTVEALRLNRGRVIRIREADVAIGRHPPVGDPVVELSSGETGSESEQP